MQVVAATFLALFCLVACAPARAAEDSLVGTWRLTSFYREVAGTGVRENQLGEHPDGYLSYDADGRMLVLLVSDEQPRPRAEPTDDQRIMLHKTMLSYGGTYSLSPSKVVHHIDIAWDGRRLGTDQVPFYTVSGDSLILKTEPNRGLVDGRDGVGFLTFTRVGSLKRSTPCRLSDCGLRSQPWMVAMTIRALIITALHAMPL